MRGRRDGRKHLTGIAAELASADGPRYLFHDFGHCFASLQLAVGASIFDVHRAMGHASIQTTEQLYGHLVPGFHDDLRKRMAQITAEVTLESRSTLRAVN